MAVNISLKQAKLNQCVWRGVVYHIYPYENPVLKSVTLLQITTICDVFAKAVWCTNYLLLLPQSNYYKLLSTIYVVFAKADQCTVYSLQCVLFYKLMTCNMISVYHKMREFILGILRWCSSIEK